jgi:osmotically inducible lipoprotein OsmB
MHRKLTIVAVASMAALAACGETTGEQALIGAGAGAATALVLDGNVAAGALIGAGGNVLACNQGLGNC